MCLTREGTGIDVTAMQRKSGERHKEVGNNAEDGEMTRMGVGGQATARKPTTRQMGVKLGFGSSRFDIAKPSFHATLSPAAWKLKMKIQHDLDTTVDRGCSCHQNYMP